MSTRYCINCGNKLNPGDKFCRKCGNPIPQIEIPKPTIHTVTSPTPPEKEPLFSDREVKEVEIPKELYEQFEYRGDLKSTKEEMENLSVEVERIMDKIKSGEVDMAEYADEIKDLKGRFAELKEKKSSLERKIKPLPHETLIKEEELWRERLQKLDSVRKEKNLSKEVYQKMKAEYEEKYATASKQRRDEIAKMQLWMRKLEDERAKMKEQLEILETRYATGELSETSYTTELKKIKDGYDKKKLALSELSEVLAKLK
ncbi:MAG: zinc-ribbon domain-containing protein [Promethearchaeota archaeon]